MDNRTQLEKTLGSLAYNYLGTVIRAQLWVCFCLYITYTFHSLDASFIDSVLTFQISMTLSFGHFFPYLSKHLRQYYSGSKAQRSILLVLLERTTLLFIFILFSDKAKKRLDRHYNIGQQWVSGNHEYRVKAELKRAQAQYDLKMSIFKRTYEKDAQKKKIRLDKVLKWAQARKNRTHMLMFTNVSRAIGSYINEIENHFHWDTDEEQLAGLFDRYQFAIPYHKEQIESKYHHKMEPRYNPNELPGISPKQSTIEGKILYLAVLIRAETDKHYDRLDFQRSDFKAGRYIYSSNRSAIDIAHWSKHLPAINAYLGGEWVVEMLDGTSLVLYQLAELPALIPFKAEFLKKGKIFYGFNVRTGERYYASLNRMPHTLVVGKSGSGKSVFLNQVMASFLYNINHFEKIYLIDLKGGVELSKYDGLHSKLHLIDNYDDLLGIFQQIYTQLENRLKLMKQNRVTIFDGAHICIICDEFAQIAQYPAITKEEKENQKLLQSYLNRLSMLGRAAKVTLLIQLQKASVDNISSNLRGNLATKICFKVHSNSEAATVFGNTEDLPAIASLGGFKNLQKGRFILSDDITGEDAYMQSSYVDPDLPLYSLLQRAEDARAVSKEQADDRVSEAE